jgi:hypothetical protein
MVPLALGALESEARAADAAIADQLFEDAKALMDKGDFAQACPKFEASYQADPALGALMNFADCLEREGKLASSFGRWGEAEEIAAQRKDPRADFARKRREALRAKLSFVTIQVSGKGEGLSVLRAGTKIGEGAFGTPLPTDPGKVAVQVARGDDVIWEKVVTLRESESQTVVIDLAAVSAANPPPMKKTTPPPSTARSGAARDDRYGGEFWSEQRIAGAVVGGVGLLGAAAGGILGGLAAAKAGPLDDECTSSKPPLCTTAGRERAAQAGTLADASTWTLIASGIVSVVGVTVFLTAPYEAELSERASIEPWIELGPGSLGMGARF